MGEPRELFETELAEIRKELLRLGVRPRESLQQSSAILEDWQHAVHHWLYRMQSEMALWAELASKLATTRSAREAFDDPWSFGLAGNVASTQSIDVQREALSLSAPTKCRAARRIALNKTGTFTAPVFSCFEAGEKGSLGKVGAGSEFLGLPELGRLV